MDIFIVYMSCVCAEVPRVFTLVFFILVIVVYVFSLLCNVTTKDSVIHDSQVPSSDLIIHCWSPYLDLWKKMAQPSTYFLSCWSMVLALDLALKMPSYP